MGYTKRIVCLAASLKNGGLCIAGREVGEGGFGRWVRPISSRDGSELTFLEYRYEDYSSPQLLDVIDVPLLGPSAHGHQTENHLIDQTRRWVKRGRAAFRRLKDLAEEPAALWLNAGSTASGHYNCLAPAEAAEFDWSLCLIRPEKAEVEVWVRTPPYMRLNAERKSGSLRDDKQKSGEKACKVAFEYKGVAYKMSVTDPAIREEFEPRGIGQYSLRDWGEIFLCVSLSETFKNDGRCHKLVAAVIRQPEA